jgi:hypothetical protein
MQKKWLPLILVLASLGFAVGCGGFQVQGVGPGTLTPCDNYLVSAIQGLSPANNAIVGVQPKLEWSGVMAYPPNGCSGPGPIDHFRVSAIEVGGKVWSEWETVGRVFSFEVTDVLKPGTHYSWWVQSILPRDWWPWSREKDGPGSHLAYFYTGPVCGPQFIEGWNDIPHPVIPAGVTQDLRPTFSWSEYQRHPENGCLVPESIIELIGPTGAIYIDIGGPARIWKPEQDLIDCTHYSWRVRDVYGDLANNPTEGPWSVSQTFVVEAVGTRCGATSATLVPITIGPPPPYYPTLTPRPALKPPKKPKTPVPACTPPPSCVAPQYLWHLDTCTCEYIPG